MVLGSVPSFSNRAKVSNDLPDFVHQAGGQQPAGADERVAPPIQKPRIAGDDRLAAAAADDKGAGGAQQLLGETVRPTAMLERRWCGPPAGSGASSRSASNRPCRRLGRLGRQGRR